MDINTSDNDLIWELTAAEFEVLFWVCRGLKNEQIANKRGVGETTVKTQLGSVYTKLSVPDDLPDNEKREYLIAAFSDAVDRIAPDENSLKTYDSQKILWRAEKRRQQSEQNEVLRGVKEDVEVLRSRQVMDEPAPRPRLRPLLWVALGIAGLVVVVAMLFIVLGGLPGTGVESTPTTSLAVADVGGTTPPLPPTNTATSTPTITQAAAVSEPSTPTPTDTTLPPTPTPTIPTSTPTATETIQPSPSALFQTSFDDNQLADGMESDSDSIEFNSGQLLGQEFTRLSIGDETWKNYEVEYETRKHTYCWGLKNNAVAAHVIDPNNMLAFSWNYCESAWFRVENGKWEIIDGTRQGNVANPGVIIKIKFVAEDGNFTVYINNKFRSSHRDDNFREGKAYIIISNTSVVDNVSVSQIP